MLLLLALSPHLFIVFLFVIVLFVLFVFIGCQDYLFIVCVYFVKI